MSEPNVSRNGQARRPRSDSVTAVVDAARNVSLPDLEPPSHILLSEEARKFWPAIIHARARPEWRPLDLVLAAQLAECQASIERETRTLATEGMVMINARGTPVQNPRNQAVQALAGREMAIMRSMQMTGSAGQNKSQLAGARQAEDQARAQQKQIRQEMDEDGNPIEEQKVANGQDADIEKDFSLLS